MARPNRRTRSHAFTPRDTALLQHARRLFVAHRYDEALDQFELAVRSEPDNPLALIDAGRAYGLRHDRARATALVERLLRLAPDDMELNFRAGETYRLMDLHREALSCFEKACRQARPAPQAWLELAGLYERTHQLEQARDALDRLLKAEPGHPGGLLIRARLERREGQSDAAIMTLEKLLAVPQPNDRIVAEAWGALALVHDERGDYEAAWRAILRCKQTQAPHAEAAWAAARHVTDRFRSLYDELSAEHMRPWAELPPHETPRRVALLTGFPRSGTTLLEQVLKGQSALVSTEERDIFSANVFPWLGRDRAADVPVAELLDNLPAERITAARKRYLAAAESYQREPLGDRWHLDKNPAMTPLIPALYRVFPEMRFVVALRDPRDVVLSCFLRYLPITPLSVHFLTLEQTVEKYLFDLRAWLRLREWLPTGWLETRYENVVTNLEGEARRVFEFLQLEWDPAALNFPQRAVSQAATSPSYVEVTAPLHTRAVSRWRHYERHLGPSLERLGPMLSALAYE